MSYLELVLVLSLAAYRLTRLVVTDTFPPIAWARDRLVDRYDEETGVLVGRRATWVPDWLEDLASCNWCVSVWVAGALTTLTSIFTDVPLPLLTFGAVAATSALLLAIEERYLTSA